MGAAREGERTDGEVRDHTQRQDLWDTTALEGPQEMASQDVRVRGVQISQQAQSKREVKVEDELRAAQNLAFQQAGGGGVRASAREIGREPSDDEEWPRLSPRGGLLRAERETFRDERTGSPSLRNEVQNAGAPFEQARPAFLTPQPARASAEQRAPGFISEARGLRPEWLFNPSIHAGAGATQRLTHHDTARDVQFGGGTTRALHETPAQSALTRGLGQGQETQVEAIRYRAREDGYPAFNMQAPIALAPGYVFPPPANAPAAEPRAPTVGRTEATGLLDQVQGPQPTMRGYPYAPASRELSGFARKPPQGGAPVQLPAAPAVPMAHSGNVYGQAAYAPDQYAGLRPAFVPPPTYAVAPVLPAEVRAPANKLVKIHQPPKVAAFKGQKREMGPAAYNFISSLEMLFSGNRDVTDRQKSMALAYNLTGTASAWFYAEERGYKARYDRELQDDWELLKGMFLKQYGHVKMADSLNRIDIMRMDTSETAYDFSVRMGEMFEQAKIADDGARIYYFRKALPEKVQDRMLGQTYRTMDEAVQAAEEIIHQLERRAPPHRILTTRGTGANRLARRPGVRRTSQNVTHKTAANTRIAEDEADPGGAGAEAGAQTGVPARAGTAGRQVISSRSARFRPLTVPTPLIGLTAAEWRPRTKATKTFEIQGAEHGDPSTVRVLDLTVFGWEDDPDLDLYEEEDDEADDPTVLMARQGPYVLDDHGARLRMPPNRTPVLVVPPVVPVQVNNSEGGLTANSGMRPGTMQSPSLAPRAAPATMSRPAAPSAPAVS
ncbi:hypothetical protein KFL_009190040 [Klebsormidium nitens]|uniref:Retrotransposon gag domain-containing protein n=1 Tax=Klebsormidium nitens TaxID=105231 RepID=A0A1Y1IMG8_KLENI|nr:hypothetical protein KFL_009190040 [Klebsormidium nitens]|eukprot:GAQ92085.1 hypothetical protein KFL_009190040 [Klebsormidium nitens]